MLLCRVLSIFFLVYTVAWGSVTAKNISQDNIGISKEKVFIQGGVSSVESDSNDLYDDTDYSLNCSGEGLGESNFTFSDDSLFDDDRFGHVIEKFINEMEVFWQDVKSLIADENNKSKPAAFTGNWWHGDTENKYHQMKERFYLNAPKELPQKVKDIINEYEMRYNDLMWSEIENIIIKQGEQEANISQDEAICAAKPTINEQTEDQNNNDVEDSTPDNKCKKRSFEDVFQVKLTKASSFTAVKCDE